LWCDLRAAHGSIQIFSIVKTQIAPARTHAIRAIASPARAISARIIHHALENYEETATALRGYFVET